METVRREIGVRRAPGGRGDSGAVIDHEAARGWTGGHGDTFIEGQAHEVGPRFSAWASVGRCICRDDERGLGGVGGAERVGQDAAELAPLSVSFGAKV